MLYIHIVEVAMITGVCHVLPLEFTIIRFCRKYIKIKNTKVIKFK